MINHNDPPLILPEQNRCGIHSSKDVTSLFNSRGPPFQTTSNDAVWSLEPARCSYKMFFFFESHKVNSGWYINSFLPTPFFGHFL